MKSRIETEIKLPLISIAQGRKLLKKNDFAVTTPRVFEENLVLDDANRSLMDRNVLLRVRRAGKLITCTSKGGEIPGRHKRREEHEFRASDFNECLAFFQTLGYAEAFRYEKYRTEFARAREPGHATLDDTPIGAFLELEGPARWIDQTAKLLGFPQNTWITLSYARLYNEWCERQGLAPSNMRFPR